MAVAGLLLSAFVGGTASADTPAVYAGSAAGQALVLTVAGQGVTAGSSAAKAASDGTASATGAGAVGQADTTADATTGQTVAEKCAQVLPPAQTAPLNTILTLGLGCGSAAAPADAATATGTVAGLDVNLQTALDLLGATAVTEPVSSTLSGILDQVCAGLSVVPVTCPVTQTAQELVQSLVATKTVSATIGSSTSSVTSASGTVTSKSTAQAATINLVPTPTLNGTALADPLATISVAQANAQAVCTLADGKATPSFDPAIVRVKLSAPIVSLLPQLPNALPTIQLPDNPVATVIAAPVISQDGGVITVTPGSTLTLFPGTPIQSTIIVGAGSTKSNPDGSVSATADGVKIHLLENIGDTVAPLAGGVLLNLAHADAAVGCSPATVDVAAPATPDVERTLPRTGGSPTPWLPIAGAAALAVAVLGRRTVLRSR